MSLNTVGIDELIQSLTEMRDKYPHAKQVVFRTRDDDGYTVYAKDCYLMYEDIMCIDATERYAYDIIYDDEDYFKEDYPGMEWNPTGYIVLDID